MPFLTVFTPTYNRVDTLARTYNSLQNQTCNDFEWIVIDDGSKDNTEEVVNEWVKAHNEFTIRYYKKENGGLHTGYNLAIEKMNDSILAMCVDSDDYLPNNAVELIKNKWNVDGSEKYGGIIGLDYDTKHQVIGGLMNNMHSLNLIKLAQGKYQIKKGDKKIICRTDLYKSVAPQRVFPGEKNFNPHYMHLQISSNYDFLVLNEEICTVDYQNTGMTANQYRQYLNSPNSFIEIRKLWLSFEGLSMRDKLNIYIHYTAEAFIAKKYFINFLQVKDKVLMSLCYLPGLLLSIIIRIKGKNK